MKHIVCFSGGHASALVGFEVARKFGTRDMVLINHDMHAAVEDADIKRFKMEVAARLDMGVTYESRNNAQQDQFDVCVEAGAFKVGNGSELCTARLKTEPFMAWLKANCDPSDTTVYYGFDALETVRIQRRSSIMAAQGWRTAFPLAHWPLTIPNTESVGIARPRSYSLFKHGNCTGCLNAGWQHWYIVYCTRPDIWAKGKWAEEEIGYAIHYDDGKPVYLEDMEERFEKMRLAGIEPTEHVAHQAFWARAKKIINIKVEPVAMPCECTEGA